MHHSGIAPLHAGLIERARPRPTLTPGGIPLAPRASETPILQKVPPSGERIGPVPFLAADASAALPQVQPHPRPPRKRYGLTVRVGPDMRAELAALTDQTGLTLQSILHTAVARYVDTLERP